MSESRKIQQGNREISITILLATKTLNESEIDQGVDQDTAAIERRARLSRIRSEDTHYDDAELVKPDALHQPRCSRLESSLSRAFARLTVGRGLKLELLHERKSGPNMTHCSNLSYLENEGIHRIPIEKKKDTLLFEVQSLCWLQTTGRNGSLLTLGFIWARPRRVASAPRRHPREA